MQNFGEIKNMFNDILIEGIVAKDSAKKDLFKKYLKTLKESDILKTQYLVYNNIENHIEENEFKASQYIEENIKLLNKFDRAEIVKENEKLNNLLEGIKFTVEYDDTLKTLHENISNLVFKEETPKALQKNLDSMSSLVEHAKTNTAKVIEESVEPVSTNILTDIAVEKYNEKYSELSESNKKMLSDILGGVDKKEVFDNAVSECLELVNQHLVETEDMETKGKLLSAKEKLLNSVFCEDTFINELGKLINLKESFGEI